MLKQIIDLKEERNNIKININDMSTFLYKSGFLSKHLIDKNKLEFLETNIKNDLIDIFEFNNSISSTYISSKYSQLINSINSLFKSEFQYNFDTLYNQYLEYTKTNFILNDFLNWLIMLNFIITNFRELLNLSDNDNIIEVLQLDKKISVIEIDNIDNINDSLSNKLEKIYENINKKPKKKNVPVNKNLIVLIYILSIGSRIVIDNDINKLSNLIDVFSLYNKIYISNINISIILYIQMIIIIKLFIKLNKSKKNLHLNNIIYSNHYYDFAINETNNNYNATEFNNYNTYNRSKLLSTGRDFNFNLNNNIKENNNENKNEANCYLFDDEIIDFPENNSIKLIMFQNYLKIFSFYYLSKNKILFTMNLSIESINEFVQHFIKIDDIKNKESNIVLFENLNDKLLNTLNINEMDILSKENISLIFSSFNFNEFLIKYIALKAQYYVERITNKYIELISKSKNCYLQESIILINNREDKNKVNIIENLSVNDLYMQYNILIFFLKFFYKNKDLKKILKSVMIKFNTYKCIFNRENKEIKLFFNFSSIKEKTLFHYLKNSFYILKLEQKYEEIITNLKDFKLYNSTIRLYQNNFRSHQVSFIFTLISKKIMDFLEDKNYNHKIKLLEANFNNYNPNMHVYIKDENIKQKTRMNYIKQMISNSYYNNKIKVLNNYLDELSKFWDLIVISDKVSDFQLLRTVEDNKIFFYLSKDKLKNIYNSIENENQAQINIGSKENIDDKKNEGNEYLNIIMFFQNDIQIYEKGINFIDYLQDDNNSVLEYKTTLICDRFYLESYILTDPRMKKAVKTMNNAIDDLYLIAKKDKSDLMDENEKENYNYNYDVYISDDFIGVQNYHSYNSKKDKNYSKIIYEFLAILSSCIEVIYYLLNNKDIDICKFIYLIKTTKDDYYIFEYKNSNMFIKKVKEFISLISLNLKECYPLFCFISKKTQTEYTISNDIFYDVFLRLFLNLNKVVDSKEKLNQLFLQKVHKNIFYEYYDSFLLIAYSFEAFNFFNDFLIKNDYLSITKGEKFEKCYFILNQGISEKKNYKILLDNIKVNNNIIIKKIIIFNFNSIHINFTIHQKILFMSYKKAEYIINKGINLIKTKKIQNINNSLDAILEIFMNKNLENERVKKIINKIKNFMIGGEIICLFQFSIKDYENILNEYYKEKVKKNIQNVENRINQLTEEAKLAQASKSKHKNKDCKIF